MTLRTGLWGVPLTVLVCAVAIIGRGLGGPADATPAPVVFGGNHASGGIVAIQYNDTTKDIAAFAADVPLGDPCVNQTQDISIFGLKLREDESFSGTVANGGIGGQFMSNVGTGVDTFVGTLTSHLGAPGFECLTSGIGYTAFGGMHPLGDVNCTWLQNLEGVGSQGEGDADGGPVTPEDALALLKFLAGVPEQPPAACPSPGDELPNGAKHGDVNCDGETDETDILDTFKSEAGVPVQRPEGCPQFGTFYSPDV